MGTAQAVSIVIRRAAVESRFCIHRHTHLTVWRSCIYTNWYIAAVRSSILFAVLAVCAGVGVSAYFKFADNGSHPDTEIPASLRSGVDKKPVLANGAGWNASPFGRGAATVQSENVANADKLPDTIYSRGGKAVDFNGKNAAQYIDQWAAAARRGDKDAAYKVYQAESVCATNDEPMANYQTEEDRKEFLNEREAIRKICNGVSPVQVQERMHFLELAARGGNNQAKIDFYMEGPGGRTDNGVLSRNDPAFKQWREDAVGYLKSAANQGDPFAMGLLSTIYGGETLGMRDTKLAMAYSIAEATARGRQLTDDQLKRRFGKQMSGSDFAAAMQMGTQISSDCCRTP